tara:strand:- start:4099 stop:4929 length:831 start_codon:yes stop_codon:yes gene_type:complete
VAHRLGILAGDGELPLKLVEVCRATGRDVFVVAFNGESNPDCVRDVPHVWLDLGSVGSALRALKNAECQDVVLAGPIRRPKLSSLRLDGRGAAMLPKLLRARGDDALLTVVIGELESEGFNVVGADDVFADLLVDNGVLSARRPSEGEWDDVARGIEVVKAIGGIDVGQAAVVHRGYVLGVEAAEGTDALIERSASLRREERGGVMVKLRKPTQDRRADLPTIGIGTIDRAQDARLAGIAVEAGETLILNRDDVIKGTNAADLFLVGVSASESPGG